MTLLKDYLTLNISLVSYDIYTFIFVKWTALTLKVLLNI